MNDMADDESRPSRKKPGMLFSDTDTDDDVLDYLALEDILGRLEALLWSCSQSSYDSERPVPWKLKLAAWPVTRPCNGCGYTMKEACVRAIRSWQKQALTMKAATGATREDMEGM